MAQRFGRYEVVAKLGEGAMAAVYLARDPVLSRFVAVKVLHGSVAAGKEALKRFFNEAKTVANVRNPHIIEVFDFGKEGREYFLVMEFVDGQSLQGVLKQLPPGEPLADGVTAALLCQAAEGLDLAARHGVVHRDIKPENLMINTQGYLKIADFGIAHLQDDSLTRTGAVLGSPLYMSPEQVRGAKPITSQSDMFSLGAVLYRCLTGTPPFSSPALKDLFRKIAREPHRPLLEVRPDLDPALASVVEVLLQKEPSRRGGGPRWLRAELRNHLMGLGLSEPMELVAAHLRELAQRGVNTTWKLDSGADVIPRTVASTSPLTVAGSLAPGATVRRTARSAPGRTQGASDMRLGEPAAEYTATRRRKSRIPIAARVAAALGLAAGVGYYALFKALSDGEPASQETAPETPPATEGRVGSAGNQPAAERRRALPPAEETGSVAGADLALRGPERIPENTRGMDSAHAPDSHSAQAPARTGEITVQSSPPFAEVFLDGRSVGVTPVRLQGVSPGGHRLLVKGRDRRSLDTLLQVKPGKLSVLVRLVPGEIAFLEEEE